jgi:hypothetical protein
MKKVVSVMKINIEIGVGLAVMWILVILKMCGYIPLSWWIVLLPFWFPSVILILLIIGVKIWEKMQSVL